MCSSRWRVQRSSNVSNDSLARAGVEAAQSLSVKVVEKWKVAAFTPSDVQPWV
ncbi:hypothetical protein HSB1_32730 [Halogranum salarium B-1]|uniref:Uncharacterized protein n=1 Tax=Halogranum salarium B-1 TaxID=1210908 RepID=J3JDX0_9EURY|nr:hypothetical protein HSB1_32730 [Halogranum salarium B-1]